jgi:cephalosporin-C deacetylase-like acetyl esterase/lysophospholipase L1-like esterase
VKMVVCQIVGAAIVLALLAASCVSIGGNEVQAAEALVVTAYDDDCIYEPGQKVGWKIEATENGSPLTYHLRKNNFATLAEGELDLADGDANVEVTVDEPAMVFLEIKSQGEEKPIDIAGAAVAPTELRPSVAAPQDFISFWAEKLLDLQAVPANPVLKPGDSGNPDVEYGLITMDHVNGGHIHGQYAKPKKPGKKPALVIFQWASPPYPLMKEWVVGHAAQGWLTVNIMPHDVLPAEPQSYYDALPDEIKKYESIGNTDRDKSHFLRMYQAAYRAVDYLANHPEWDGKTLVCMGTSMGGQQSLAAAGLHPKVSHVIANVPAGCDTNGPLHGRQASYPNFPVSDPDIAKTALYFDIVNFAPHIRATTLIGMGFVDEVSAPAGVWTAFNLIPGPKQIVPLTDMPHNHQATPAQLAPYEREAQRWLTALAKGEKVEVNAEQSDDASDSAETFDDHQNMMDQLGIKSLRPGADPNNQSIFVEANANPYKDSMPEVLTMKDGTHVTSREQWLKRRAEILEDFEREVYGRIPANVPQVRWEVTEITKGESAGIPTITKTLLGHVDNSAYPKVSVAIEARFTVPADSTEARPVMIEFGGFGRFRGFGNRPGVVPWTDQAIAHGWGHASINPASIQPDNNDFRAGIIGLTNKGQPRKPDDWGALRAWQWGASRLLDYFVANPDSGVDPSKVGIVGLSRYGKAAIVTEAFDERFAVGLIASSGEGGVKLHRHIFGEAVENLTGGGYYWMAGNFIKYGAAEASFGSKTAADLPVDSHQLIALCAPRPCFISYGIIERGDPQWVDARGSFMAGILAGPVYELLGKKGFGTSGNYLTDSMPPVNELIGGELAWRQHDGGHEVTPNWPAFFKWVAQYIPAPPRPEAAVAVLSEVHSDRAASVKSIPRQDENSKLAHEQLVAKAKQGGIDVYFLGDSITRRWGTSDEMYKPLLENWKKNFFGWNAGNFGWGADSTHNILWRIENGELDGVNPKVIVLLGGTNNVGGPVQDDAKVEEVVDSIEAILAVCQEKAPDATIILTAILPRNDNMAAMPTINRINARLEKLADGDKIRFLNVNDKLADADGKLFEGMTHDKLHLTVKGYQVWADGLKPILTEILGPPAKTDHAPPPTGDPSAR